MQTINDEPEIEYIAGRAYQKMSPKLAHGLTQAACLRVLYACAAGRGATSSETRFSFCKGTALVPDVSFVSYDRLRGLTEEQIEQPPFAPDIAIEVRSKSDRDSLIQEKTALYLQYGSVLVLNVDPYSRTLTAHTEHDAWPLTAADRFGSAAVPWLVFDVAALFADLDFPR